MTIQKLYRRFAEWVTRWELNNKVDEFFEARLGLTVYYLVTAIIILGGSSIITYNAILSNLTQSILERGFDRNISQLVIADAQTILLNRFFTIDSLIILSTVIIGFLLTSRTLKPIKSNMLKQKRFIADASHELRTPIAVVISGLEVTLQNKKLDFPLAKKTLENTLDEMRELAELSKNLLDLSKYNMSSTKIRYEPIRIDEKIKRIADKNLSLARLKDISIETNIEPEAVVLGNRIELARVFYNIFDNAIKYTPHNGTIKVSGEIHSNKYVIMISDNGIGINQETIGKIFDPFFRGDEARNTGGAGLGLTLSKKIIENHKGTISIESNPGRGTTVRISLPLSS
jgi:signal transduction histidine kinase